MSDKEQEYIPPLIPSIIPSIPSFQLFGHSLAQGAILQIVLDHSLPGSPTTAVTRIGKLHEVKIDLYSNGMSKEFLSLIPHGDDKKYPADIIGEMAIEPIDNIKEIIILKHG